MDIEKQQKDRPIKGHSQSFRITYDKSAVILLEGNKLQKSGQLTADAAYNV